jgi:hypothetical protein
MLTAALKRAVRERATFCCEYCRFPESRTIVPFHFDHIIARQHGGKTALENLALSCCYCNRFKGTNLASIDPLTGKITALFNPRIDQWGEHFSWEGPILVALTSTGRATAEALNINRLDAIRSRNQLIQEGILPARS